MYCGKIFVPPFKEEEGYFVIGQHEPLISEKMFYDVQAVLDGRTRVVKPKIMSMDNLPLRGFLKCPNCNRMLTGSASKGKMGVYYYYYHCTSSCGTRFRAEEVNEAFVKQLRYLSPKSGIVDVFIEAFLKDFNMQTKTQNAERANIIAQIDTLNKRYQNALIKNADGELDYDDFQELKKLTKSRIEALEKELNNLAVASTEIRDLMASSLKKVANIDKRYEYGNIEEKRTIISSIFPENLVYDGTRYRTQRINSAISLIYQNTNKLKGKKNGTNLFFSDLSREVIRAGFEPTTHSLEGCCSIQLSYRTILLNQAAKITQFSE